MATTKIPVGENAGNLENLSKHREFCLNTGKTQGILLAQVVNVLNLKVKNIAIVTAKKEIGTGKIWGRTGKHREFENTI